MRFVSAIGVLALLPLLQQLAEAGEKQPLPVPVLTEPLAVVKQLRVGMTEEAARTALKPVTRASGTVYWGGSGARRVYFQVAPNKQVWVEIGPGPEGKVVQVGPLEPKQRWTRHRGDSITVD